MTLILQSSQYASSERQGFRPPQVRQCCQNHKIAIQRPPKAGPTSVEAFDWKESWGMFRDKTTGRARRFDVHVSKCLPMSMEREGSAGRAMKRVSVALRNPHSGRRVHFGTNQTAFSEFPETSTVRGFPDSCERSGELLARLWQGTHVCALPTAPAVDVVRDRGGA